MHSSFTSITSINGNIHYHQQNRDPDGNIYERHEIHGISQIPNNQHAPQIPFGNFTFPFPFVFSNEQKRPDIDPEQEFESILKNIKVHNNINDLLTEKDDNCCICYDMLINPEEKDNSESNDYFIKLPCNHDVHEACFYNYADHFCKSNNTRNLNETPKTKLTCPICRHVIYLRYEEPAEPVQSEESIRLFDGLVNQMRQMYFERRSP